MTGRLIQIGAVKISRARTLQGWVTIGGAGDDTSPTIELVFANGGDELGSVFVRPGTQADEIKWLIGETEKACFVAAVELAAVQS
jgi:hypothetical protein